MVKFGSSKIKYYICFKQRHKKNVFRGAHNNSFIKSSETKFGFILFWSGTGKLLFSLVRVDVTVVGNQLITSGDNESWNKDCSNSSFNG